MWYSREKTHSMNIVLFLTFGMSLKKWAHGGMLAREIALYREFKKNGHQVTFVTYGNDQDLLYREQLEGINIVPVYKGREIPSSGIYRFFHSFFLPFRLKAVIKEADILKTNQMWGSWVAVIAKVLYRRKLVIRCGYEQFRFALMMKMPFAFKLITYVNSLISYWMADAVIISSEIGREFIRTCFKVPASKITVVYNYVDTDIFKPLGHEKISNKILFVGRLEKEKNLFNLLNAIRQTPYHLDIVGEGRLRRELEEYIKRYSIHARLMGTVPNKRLPELYHQYPVYILPSLCEGMPKTLLEAMACGTAVIGTNIEGINNLITHEKNGYLCTVLSDSIRDAVQKVMSDSLLRERLGNAAREFILQNNSLAVIISKEQEVYSTMMRK